MDYFEKTFEESELIGSTLKSLNDPFEGGARIFDDLHNDVLEDCCHYFDRQGVGRDARSDKAFVGLDKAPKYIVDRLNRTIENARILSFCRRSDSHLLWSHYANSHKGACIHFTVNAFIKKDLTLGEVAYTRYRPVVPQSLLARMALVPSRNHHTQDRSRLRKELYNSLFFIKPDDWSYEEEVRVVYSSAQMTNVKFSASKIFEVFIGAKCSPEDEDRIRSIVAKHAAGVAIRKAHIDRDTFAVGIGD